MQKRTREIIALILLIVLLVGGIGGAAWYVFVGHNWNAAATNIDDRIGNMEGYTVILCEGAVPSLAEQREISISQPMLEEENFGTLDSGRSDSESKRLTVQEALDSYREKGAQVVIVHTDEPQRYEDPIIVPKQGRRIGVFSAEGPQSNIFALFSMLGLKSHAVDFSIGIVDDFATAEPGLVGVDLVICTDYESAGEEGRYVGNAYVMGAPYDGQVGAVIISPSGFLTSKMLDVA